MKLKNLIVMLILAPISIFVTWEASWFIYDLLDLFSVTVESYSNLTLAISLLVFSVVFYKGYRLDATKKEEKTGKTKNGKSKKQKSPLDLNKEVTLTDVQETLRPSKKHPLLEFIIIGTGKNLHQVVPFKKDATYKTGGKTFKIENEHLLIQKPFWGRKKLTAIISKDGTPLKIEASQSPITSEILGLAQRSTALENKIAQMFATHLDLKKILFFVVIGVVAVVVVLVLSGGI